MSDLPSVSLVSLVRDWPQFHSLVKYHWEHLDYPKNKLEWILIDDSNTDYSDNFPLDERILYIRISPKDYLEKIEFPKDDSKQLWKYQEKINQLPDGFKRDYAVGLTSHDYIFHLDLDTYYQPKAIKRKLSFLQNNKLECVYCKSMLSYDIYGKKLYKIENPYHGYESTLFHTKKFWERGGFNWSDLQGEAVGFYYNKGLDRTMDNYYDTIKILSVHNIHRYQPKSVTLNNLEITIPDEIQSLVINKHPLQYELNDLFQETPIDVLSINSEMTSSIANDSWNIQTISTNGKIKEKHIIKEIKGLDTNFDLCILNSKNPVWTMFDVFSFPHILIENEKNREQMHSILTSKGYSRFQNVYLKIPKEETNDIPVQPQETI